MPPFNPRDVLSKMMVDFSLSSKDLLTITNREFYENTRENAVYGILYGRPTPRFSTLLNIDREILILVTSFDSQQTRTIKTLTAQISESSGRLENTVAIVVHPDIRGNTNLKAWGKDSGILVLPLFYSQTKFPMKPEEFENALCKEMYTLDPFDVTGPVSDLQFFGRRNEAITIAQQLQNGHIKSILGLRKIGKTSLLNRIVEICKEEYKCIILMIDCSTEGIFELYAKDLVFSIYTGLKVVKENKMNYMMISPIITDKPMHETIQLFIKEIENFDCPIIIIFDEIDYITPSCPMGNIGVQWEYEFNTFWRNIRVIYQESARQNKPFSLLVSGVSSKWFRIESINGIENSALSLIPEDYLGIFPRRITISMIRHLSRVVGLQINDNIADVISEVCCDSPHWVRKACSYMHNRIDIQARPLSPDPILVKKWLDEFIEYEGITIAQGPVKHLFRVYPELILCCKNCLLEKYSEVHQGYINVLERYGILRIKDGKHELSGTLVKECLASIFDEKSEIINKPTDFIGEEEKGYLERWADDLGHNNKRRNIIEKKLRGIVLNFIRMDSLSDKTKPKAKDRISKRIDEKRRAELSHFSLEDIMESLFWTELINIIDKEWSLFEKAFGDKNELRLNSSTISDRLDAHAKDFDEADIALYRRALKWFENHIDAL
jgi:hypothetical protein